MTKFHAAGCHSGEKGANANLTRRPGISLTLLRSHGGATQLTHYAIVDTYIHGSK